MRWLIDELAANGNFITELPNDSRCGTVHGAVFGALENNGPVVDVALVKMEVEVATKCASSLTFPELTSPSLTQLLKF